ncbi:MAG: hypothetical protein KDC44_13685, partial [Phaeodactylibacter sp.]|nr:hypothetical protein [Phaeodactylibacter sp.]
MQKNIHFLSLFFLLFGSFTQAQINLQVTEIFSGQAGTDLTKDWFEIRNDGTEAWVVGADPDLYYDDDSAAPAEAALIEGLVDIQPGETVLVLITGTMSNLTIFNDIWGSVIDLTGIEIGYADGSNLGSSGDAVTIWMGMPNTTLPIISASYPDASLFDGQSYDLEL